MEEMVAEAGAEAGFAGRSVGPWLMFLEPLKAFSTLCFSTSLPSALCKPASLQVDSAGYRLGQHQDGLSTRLVS